MPVTYEFSGSRGGVSVAGSAGALDAGSVLFADSNGEISEDNANFFWDDTNDNLLIGTNATLDAGVRLQVVGKASEKTAIFRANATAPGNIIEVQDSAGGVLAFIVAEAAGGRLRLIQTDDIATVIGIQDVNGDANNVWQVRGSGQMDWGAGGASAVDVSLSRSAANTLALATGDSLSITDANIILGTTTGTKIGTATTQKLAFYNATPIVQGASVADAAGGLTIDSEARAAINALISRIEATGLIATV